MSALAADYFRQNALLVLPVVALVIFVAVFVLVTVRTLSKRARSWDDVARLPLEDGSATERDGQGGAA